MGTIVSPDGRFEWEESKNNLNKEDHGFYFEEVLAVFDDPFFLEAYDDAHSTMEEVRLKGIASFDQRVYFFLSYTERGERTRLFSARLAEAHERKYYDENYRQQVSGYDR